MTLDPSQFELGEDVTAEFEVQKSKRSGVVVSVRINPDDADSLFALAERTQRTVSQVAREAIHSYLESGDRPIVVNMTTVMPISTGALVVYQAVAGFRTAVREPYTPLLLAAPLGLGSLTDNF